MNTMAKAFLLVLAFLLSGALHAADVTNINSDTLLKRSKSGDASLLILDVRTPEEYADGHVPGAVNIPYDKINGRLDELLGAKNKDIVLYCHSGARAAIAAETLQGKGFAKLLHLEGDMVKWKREKLPTEK